MPEHVCEVCGAAGELEEYQTILFCVNCLTQEKQLQRKNKVESESRVQETRIPRPDSSIQISTDIFNAKIASINELKNAIEKDESTENKHFALARVLDERYKHLKEVITGATDTIRDASNEVRAIQTYYNDLAKKLKTEEREAIKIADVKYQPPEKPTKKVSAPTVKKYDKQQIKMASAQSNIPEALIQMTCVARQVTPMEAVRILREAGVN